MNLPSDLLHSSAHRTFVDALKTKLDAEPAGWLRSVALDKLTVAASLIWVVATLDFLPRQLLHASPTRRRLYVGPTGSASSALREWGAIAQVGYSRERAIWQRGAVSSA